MASSRLEAYRCPLCRRPLRPFEGRSLRKMFRKGSLHVKQDVVICDNCYRRVALKVALLDPGGVRLRKLVVELAEAVEESFEAYEAKPPEGFEEVS